MEPSTNDTAGNKASPMARAKSFTISSSATSEGEKTHRSVDLLGRVYEYFLTRFASAEGKNGGHSSGARKTAKGSPQGERGGVHQFGVPPKGNANFAWVQHFIHHLAPHGMAGFIGVSIGRGACLNEVETTFAMHDNDTFDNSIRHEA